LRPLAKLFVAICLVTISCSESKCADIHTGRSTRTICGNTTTSTTSVTHTSTVQALDPEYLGYWRDRDVMYFIDKNWPESMKDDDFPYNIHRAVDKWSRVNCSGIRLTYGGEVDRKVNIYEACDMATPGAIFISMTSDNWGLPSQFLGYALICKGTFDNEFYGVSILINDDDYSMSNHTTKASRSDNIFDFETILMHELGHSLGVPHPNRSGEVMTSSIAPGSVRNNLTAGDIRSLCGIYSKNVDGLTDPKR
jgi:hypothetical protein